MLHGIITRRAHAHLSSTPDKRAAPLHAASVPSLDTDSIIREMLPDHQKRVRTMWGAYGPLSTPLNGETAASQHFSEADACLLVEAHVVVHSTDATWSTVLGTAFAVAEETHGVLLHCITLWPKLVSDWLATQGYRAPGRP